jgi:hypothetical protein
MTAHAFTHHRDHGRSWLTIGPEYRCSAPRSRGQLNLLRIVIHRTSKRQKGLQAANRAGTGHRMRPLADKEWRPVEQWRRQWGAADTEADDRDLWETFTGGPSLVKLRGVG